MQHTSMSAARPPTTHGHRRLRGRSTTITYGSTGSVEPGGTTGARPAHGSTGCTLRGVGHGGSVAGPQRARQPQRRLQSPGCRTTWVGRWGQRKWRGGARRRSSRSRRTRRRSGPGRVSVRPVRGGDGLGPRAGHRLGPVPGQRQEPVPDLRRPHRARLPLLLPEPEVPVQARPGTVAAVVGRRGERRPSRRPGSTDWHASRSERKAKAEQRAEVRATRTPDPAAAAATQARRAAPGRRRDRRARAVAHRPGAAGSGGREPGRIRALGHDGRAPGRRAGTGRRGGGATAGGRGRHTRAAARRTGAAVAAGTGVPPSRPVTASPRGHCPRPDRLHGQHRGGARLAPGSRRVGRDRRARRVRRAAQRPPGVAARRRVGPVRAGALLRRGRARRCRPIWCSVPASRPTSASTPAPSRCAPWSRTGTASRGRSTEPGGSATVAEALREYATAVAAEPWLERWPMLLRDDGAGSRRGRLAAAGRDRRGAAAGPACRRGGCWPRPAAARAPWPASGRPEGCARSRPGSMGRWSWL